MAQQATINISVNSTAAQNSVNQLSESINNAGNSAASLKTQLRQVTQELQQLEPGSARFQELSARAGQLRDQIQDTNAVITATAGNVTENFGKALGSAVQIGVAGFQGLMAVQTLFGTENEELNKSIAKMTALLNLSQAITSFGGLKDSLTSIKAGLTPILTTLGLMATTQTEVAVATTAADAALVGEAAAAEGATVATGALGTAMNALPLIALVSALGLLVAGVIKYSQSSSEAAKEEKKREQNLKNLKKQKEENKKAQEQETQSVVAASKEYVRLIYQIKNTTAGTKERKKAIDEVNKTYGTTLQNLSDEFAFQEQLNKSVRDYISLQVVKIRQEKNIEKIAALIDEQAKANGRLYKAQQRQAQQAKESNLTNKQVYDNFQDIRVAIDDAQRSVLQYQFKIDALTLTSEELAKQELELSKGFKGGNDGLKDRGNTLKDVNDETDKYSNLLDEIKKKIERETSLIDQQQKIREKQIAGSFERQLEETINFYDNEQKQIIDRATENELNSLDEKFKKGLVKEDEYVKTRQDIINNGYNYLTQAEKDFYNQLDTYRNDDIQKLADSQNLKEKIISETTKNIQTNTQLIQLQFEKSEAERQIDESEKTEEQKNEAKLEVRRKYAQQEIDLLNKNLQEQKNIAKLNLDETLADEEKSLSEKEQAQKQYDQNVIKMTQDTADQINKINDGIKPPIPDEDEFKKKADEFAAVVGKYVDAISTLWGQLENTINMLLEERYKNQEAKINNIYDLEKETLDNQLRNQIITQEQFDIKQKELEQQKEQDMLALKKKEFETSKKLQIANATIQGAQAVLAAYSSGAAIPIIGAAVGIAMAAVAAGISAVQIGIIKNTEFTAAQGGIVPGNGSPYVDSVPSLLAPGETVINATSSSMYPELLSQINEVGGGNSLVPNLPQKSASQTAPAVYSVDQKQQPIRAYVVETDVTDTQKRVNRIKRSVEF